MRVFIHGSCVARDLLTILRDHGFELSYYSPRQSLIGLLGAIDGLEQHLDLSALSSRFQRRVVEGSIRADLINQFEEHAPNTDLVLWDLTDERLGVYEIDGRFVTRTLELISAGLDERLQRHAKFIPFGTDEHFDLWTRAMYPWHSALQRSKLDERVILLAPQWADRFGDGALTPTSFGVSALEHKMLADRYYDHVSQVIPAVHVVGRSVRTSSSRNHHWGPAPFHFDNPTNTALAAEVGAVVMSGGGELSLPRPVVTQIGPCRVVVESPPSWGEAFALYVLNRRGRIQQRLPYQNSAAFDLVVESPGTYIFRVFHRAAETTSSADSAATVVR